MACPTCHMKFGLAPRSLGDWRRGAWTCPRCGCKSVIREPFSLIALPMILVVFWAMKLAHVPMPYRILVGMTVVFVCYGLVRRVPIGEQPSWVAPLHRRTHRLLRLVLMAGAIAFVLGGLALLIHFLSD